MAADLAEDLCSDAGPIRDAQEGDLGHFRVVRDAADNNLFHQVTLSDTRAFVPVEARAHVDRDAEAARDLDRPVVENLRPERGQLQHLVVR